MRSVFSYLKIILLFLVSVIALSQANTLEEVVKRQMDFVSGGKLTVKNVNGRVTVEAWDKEEVYMEAVKQVKTDDRDKAQKAMERLEIIIEQSQDEIYIQSRHPRSSGESGFFDWLFGDHTSTNVSYSLRVPRSCHLRISSTNGTIAVMEVTGNMSLKTTNGKIRADRVGGAVYARTTNGSIEGVLTSFEEAEDLEFTTTNGSVNVTLPQESRFDLRAKTTNGSISTDFPIEIEGRYDQKRIRAKINGGGPLLYLETTNGNIRLHKS
ncbi:MAG: DUF4097 family beta strand repeat protein [Aliifodinibius sp.]|nr:DUF4097 family beta strand repeat protein [Fodinibius sp.]NIV12190.1 DUF4097 family beta strand repeat protein [Fodinibius sp.]NIY23648.1 DUF4097 family beta strand repeat protein [Fodinibius sp.]